MNRLKMFAAQLAVAVVVASAVSYTTSSFIVHQNEQEFWRNKRIAAREQIVAEYQTLVGFPGTPEEAVKLLQEHWFTVYSLSNVFDPKIESNIIAYHGVLMLMQDRAESGEKFWTDVYFTPIFTFLDIEMKSQIGL